MESVSEISQRLWNRICQDHRIKCLEINISEACNYNCSYCIFHRNIQEKALMKPELARNITLEYMRYLSGEKGLIYLGAGEPLLNWDAVVCICEALKSAPNQISLNFMTNASLLTKERMDYIAENHIHVGFSIDGKKEYQAQSRSPKDATINSFDVVIRALEYAKQTGYPVFSLSSTYRSVEFRAEAEYVMSLCTKYGIPEFDLDYDIAALTEETIEAVAENLVFSLNKAKEKKLSVFGYWLIPYLNRDVDRDSICYCGNAFGNNICVSACGDLKICGYDPVSYGKFSGFDDVFQGGYLDKLRENTFLPEECMECKLRETCLGQCIFQSKESPAFSLNCKLLRKIDSII